MKYDCWPYQKAFSSVGCLLKQQIYIIIVMKHHKYKEQAISAWANQDDTNYDAIQLTNIIIRKTTAGVLPQINNMRSRTQMQDEEQRKSSNLMHTKRRFNHKSSHILKIKREKPDTYEYIIRERPVLRDQNEQFVNNYQKEVCQNYTPTLNCIQNIHPPVRHSNFSQDNQKEKGFIQKCKREEVSSIFSKTMKTHPTNTKSMDFVMKTIDKVEPSKKSEPKLQVKLNTLEMVSSLKKQFKYDCLQKLSDNGCKMEQSDGKVERRKISNKIRAGSIEKMNQKLNSTFLKKDIFSKGKRKLSKNDNVQFSDQVIFTNNSIVVSKQMVANPFLHSKIQILMHSGKYQRILK